MSFDLMAYARQRRYRTRNLQDGHAVPPARPPKHGQRGPVDGYVGANDRMNAVIGRHGYVAMDGERLSVFASYRSRRAKTAGMAKLVDAGVTIDQEGDIEVGGWAPVEQIEAVLAAIGVSKLPLRNRSPNLDGLRRYQRGSQAPESTQAAGKVVKVGAGAESAVWRAVVGCS